MGHMANLNMMLLAAAGGQPPQQNAQFDFTATDTNYSHYREYDFDPQDRPWVYP